MAKQDSLPEKDSPAQERPRRIFVDEYWLFDTAGETKLGPAAHTAPKGRSGASTDARPEECLGDE